MLPTAMSATILTPGFLTTVQDDGRVGFRKIGVSTGGALDAHALRVGNLLVGNEPSAAGLEITLGGFRARFNDSRAVAWCGGEFSVRIGDAELSAGRVGVVRAGEEVDVANAESGCRAWLAISGGVDVPHVLGSRATDLRAQFGGVGGRALQRDDLLEFAPMARFTRFITGTLNGSRTGSWLAPAGWAKPASRHAILRVVAGSEWPLFRSDSRLAFCSDAFTITPEADRMGVRLEGPPLNYEGAELLSQAVTAGTIQVPPSGGPIILLPDCQTIGGYPKLAHVITVDLPIAAQLRPGNKVRFREISLPNAHRLLLQRERDLGWFRVGLSLRKA